MSFVNCVHNVWLYSVLDTVVISGYDVCCRVVFGTLVGVFSSVMWSKLLMTPAISCPLWSSVFFLRGRFIEINKVLYKIVRKKETK